MHCGFDKDKNTIDSIGKPVDLYSFFNQRRNICGEAKGMLVVLL